MRQKSRLFVINSHPWSTLVMETAWILLPLISWPKSWHARSSTSITEDAMLCFTVWWILSADIHTFHMHAWQCKNYFCNSNLIWIILWLRLNFRASHCLFWPALFSISDLLSTSFHLAYDMNRKQHRCIETDRSFRLSNVGSIGRKVDPTRTKLPIFQKNREGRFTTRKLRPGFQFRKKRNQEF